MSSSKIMNEFWGLVGSHVWTFVIGIIVGILICLYAQNTPDEPRPSINIEHPQPQPSYIPRGLNP
jgi:hypothetical protein